MNDRAIVHFLKMSNFLFCIFPGSVKEIARNKSPEVWKTFSKPFKKIRLAAHEITIIIIYSFFYFLWYKENFLVFILYHHVMKHHSLTKTIVENVNKPGFRHRLCEVILFLGDIRS